MATHLFIDTNIFLAFYLFTNDDLEELNKLSHLIEQGEIVLLLPDQVRDEFKRNREVKIAEALKGLRNIKLNFSFPHLCRDYSEYNDLRDLQKRFDNLHSSMMKILAEDIEQANLKADKLINSLFEKGKHLETTDEILEKARRRRDLRNPPGKADSLGDAINWEALLSTAETYGVYSLHFISDDRDYKSPIDDLRFNEFLFEEWKKRRMSAKILYYHSLSKFFKKKYPDIRLSDEIQKDEMISALVNSNNFSQTHGIVEQLSKYDYFTSAQKNTIVSAALSNTQIRWILKDEDIEDFLRGIIGHAILPFGKEYELMKLLDREVDEKEVVDDDLPF